MLDQASGWQPKRTRSGAFGGPFGMGDGSAA